VLSISPACLALVEILRRIEEQPYHWLVDRTMFHVLAYVATSEGLPTGFVYQKGSSGPFSRDLKIAEAKLVNNNLLQEERQGSMFMVKVGPNFESVRKDVQYLLDPWTPLIEKTTDLFMSMNTDQAEIVATIIFAADALKKQQNAEPTETEVLDSVLQWKQKLRPSVDTSFVASTIRNLGMLRWLHVKPDANLPVPEEELVEV
jgi:hypothetical protein